MIGARMAEERAKGFVQAVRHQYVHNACGATTWMGDSLAETYARDPWFYGGTYCSTCCTHFPLHEFRWAGTDESLCPGHWTDEKFNQIVAAKKALKDAAP